MITLSLIGIGTGNLDHLTGQAIREINRADIVLIPQKGAGKADLADLRHAICAEVLTNPNTKIIGFDLPKRDADTPSYYQGVDDWHDAIAAAWHQAIAQNLGASGRVALLVWGDPSLYDSSLRISKRLIPAPKVEVVAGLTSLQLLTAAHAIELSEKEEPILITTGGGLRDHGWPKGVDAIAVLKDDEISHSACAFQTLETEGIDIWWGAYLGMQNQLLIAGPLEEKGPTILETRAKARQNHGWVMDIYLMRKSPKVKS